MCNIPGCIDIFSNNAITLFTSKCLLLRDLDKFAQLQPNYAIISLTKRVRMCFLWGEEHFETQFGALSQTVWNLIFYSIKAN